jgi:shikimate kinase
MEQPRAVHNLALVGFMGTGKSSVGQLVAERLHFEFLDTDDCVETRAAKTIAQIFAEDGEAAFRQHECEVVKSLESRRNTVIATGGGLVTNPDCLASLRTHALIVCLWASPETIWHRVRHQSHRPLLQTVDPQARIRLLLAQRNPFYRQADILLNTEWRSPRQIAQIVITQFRSSRRLSQASRAETLPDERSHPPARS